MQFLHDDLDWPFRIPSITRNVSIVVGCRRKATVRVTVVPVIESLRLMRILSALCLICSM